MDITGSREGRRGWDLSENDQYYEAKKRANSREGILLIVSARHVANGGEVGERRPNRR